MQPEAEDPDISVLSTFDHALAGGLSGAFTRLLCQPLDVLKIRFQLQVEPIVKCKSKSKYTSVIQAFRLIIHEERWTSLWKGHVPAQALSIIFSTTQFSCYEVFNKHTQQFHHYLGPEVVEFSCGALAGAVATVVANPFDVVRTRLIAQDKIQHYHSVRQALYEITKHEGAKGVFRGCLPSMLQVAPFTGAQFMFYHLFNRIYQSSFDKTHENEPVWGFMVTGGLSGLCSKALVYPLDLVKKRLQIQQFHEHRKSFGEPFICHGMISCIESTVSREGLLGLYKGLGPSLLKAVFSAALHFASYEQFLRLLT